jgi:hypothetical protein
VTKPRIHLTSDQQTVLAVAEAFGTVSVHEYRTRTISILLGHGMLRPAQGQPSRSGLYEITKAGREARARAARMSLTPPGDDEATNTINGGYQP